MVLQGKGNCKEILDRALERYNVPDFVWNDPVRFPRAFSSCEDIETVSLLVSTIAWGRREQIASSAQKIVYEVMEGNPYEYVMSGRWESLPMEMNLHRTFFAKDMIYLCRGLRDIFSRYGGMEPLFVGRSVWEGIALLREEMARSNGGRFTKHLSNPLSRNGGNGSACKRLHMMLRWLSRKDGVVDLGIWKRVSPASLMMPLDVHVARMGRTLGLISRLCDDRRTVEELTARLSEFCAEDPVKYDFALFGMGEEEKRASNG